MRGTNIEFNSPKVDKSGNGYVRGWTKKECLKKIDPFKDLRYFRHKDHFLGGYKYLIYNGDWGVTNTGLLVYATLDDAIKHANRGSWVEITKKQAEAM